jgi:hypothetical protein
MTDVTYAGSSTELWRFDTSIRGWTRVHNGDGPGTRRFHVMTAVGLDLWLHGGETDSGEGDVSATHVLRLLLLSRAVATRVSNNTRVCCLCTL